LQGKRLLAFGASFKKMELVRKNLAALAASPDEPMAIDPNGLAVVLKQPAQL
jgi:hypothetical protein